jgi:hypothetical protein
VSQGQNNAAVAALNRFALLAGPYPSSGLPENQFEAENATINRILLEANYGDFTGWGYVAGWNGNNQWVRFNVNFPDAGARTLTFRYAAGAGNASRLIAINGSNVFPNQPFANTGGWENYSTVSVTHEFPSGPNTIAVIHNSALGNNNYLNLDHMVVTDLKIRELDVAPGGPPRLTWDAVPGQTYQLQYTTQFPGGDWNNLGGAITATGTTAIATDPADVTTNRFYRLRLP